MANLIRRCLTLHNGLQMPCIGVGTYKLLGDELKAVIDKAFFFGYRHIDTALSYKNEREIGETIATRLAAGGSRDELFITSKIPSIYLAPKDVAYSVEQSRENLKLSYIDLMLLHNPWGLANRGDGDTKPEKDNGELDFKSYNLVHTWRALEDLVIKGQVKSIGLSNFTVKQIDNIVQNCRIKPANVQLECHPYYQQDTIQKYCTPRGITLTAYSSLGATPIPEQNCDEKPVVLVDSRLKEVALQHNKSPAQIVLAWLLSRGFCVIPKTKTPARLVENLNVFDIQFTSHDLTVISNMDCRVRYLVFKYMNGHPDFNINEEF